MIYGTAWKEDRTADLTALALAAGFRAIDTANQRKHYFEAAVGDAIARSKLPRSELWLQTKFTYQRGQDHRLPYDPAAPVGEQVRQSFASSLAHLGTTYVDSYVLHGPEAGQGWSAVDREAWAAMEALHDAGVAKQLGVSNISAAQLQLVCKAARVPPAAVQNRCYARTGWDREVRAICRERGITYQGFSLLTANTRELQAPAISGIAARTGATVPQVVFRFCERIGIRALTGTTSRAHMDEDLAASKVELTEADVRAIESI